MRKFPSFSDIKKRIHYIFYEQISKPRKIIQNQMQIELFAAFAYPMAWVIVWIWFANLVQYTWVLFVVEAIVAPLAAIDWVRHRKERAEGEKTKY